MDEEMKGENGDDASMNRREEADWPTNWKMDGDQDKVAH